MWKQTEQPIDLEQEYLIAHQALTRLNEHDLAWEVIKAKNKRMLSQQLLNGRGTDHTTQIRDSVREEDI